MAPPIVICHCLQHAKPDSGYKTLSGMPVFPASPQTSQRFQRLTLLRQ
jgi:hypothetical protein